MDKGTVKILFSTFLDLTICNQVKNLKEFTVNFSLAKLAY